MRHLAVAALLICVSATIHAAPITIVKQEMVYEVAEDGTWTTELNTARRVNETQAIAGMGQAPVPYSESMQSLEILEAYTVTKDGQRIDVPADKILTQQQPASAGAPTFSDYKLRVVVFPQVEVGATLHLHYRLKQLKPFLPGVFSAATNFNLFVDTESASVTLRAPAKLKLHIGARDVSGGEVKSPQPGRREWHWTYSNLKPVLPEPGSMMPETFSPYVAASTMPDYPALAQAYMVGATPAAKVTPDVQQLADQITTGITDRREQAAALYRWVSSQIRYVAIAMGAGGYVPHAASEVIAARYGDCKDKSTLLIALLQAKGIRAMPALIHTGATFQLPDPVLLGAFNHAITYLPDWDLFVDSTSGFAPFGVLPSPLQAKPALLGGDGKLKAALRTTPGPAGDVLVLRTVAKLDADGTVTGSNRVDTRGALEATMRASMASINETTRAAMAQQLLSSGGQTGEATLQLSNARDLTTPFQFLFDFKTPQRVNMPGPGALPTSFGMALPAGAQSFAASVLRVNRKLDFPCPKDASEEHVELSLPQGMTITVLPKPVDLSTPYGRFTASYEVKDGKLVTMQRMQLTPPRPVCTAADTAPLREFATAIAQQTRAQILYQ